MNRVKIAFKGCVLQLLLLLQITLPAQTNTVTFGQNRVQYKDFTFQYYESDNFITHFYQGGQDVAKYTIKTAEDVSDEIATLLDFKYRRKIDIIVYNTINELNQTNIGIYEQGQVPGGTTKLPENKMFATSMATTATSTNKSARVLLKYISKKWCSAATLPRLFKMLYCSICPTGINKGLSST